MTLDEIAVVLKSLPNNECLLYTVSTGKHFACYWHGQPPGSLIELLLHCDYRDGTAELLYHSKAVSNTFEGISFFHNQGPRGPMND